MGYGRKRKRRPFISAKTQGWLLGFLAALCAAAVIWTFLPRPAPVVVDAVDTLEASEVAQNEPEAFVPPLQIADAMVRTKDDGRPFTIGILGDSTGADAVSWVTLVGEELGAIYDRTVIMHPWSEGTKPVGYQEPRQLHTGSNADITIYNASAPSTNAAHTRENLKKMLPHDVDLVFMNHGHNHTHGTMTRPVRLIRDNLKERMPDAVFVPIIQNPEKPGSPHSTIQNTNLAYLKDWALRSRHSIVDVHAAYRDSGDFSKLYKDNVHPDGEKGYRLWADTVLEALGH